MSVCLPSAVTNFTSNSLSLFLSLSLSLSPSLYLSLSLSLSLPPLLSLSLSPSLSLSLSLSLPLFERNAAAPSVGVDQLGALRVLLLYQTEICDTTAKRPAPTNME